MKSTAKLEMNNEIKNLHKLPPRVQQLFNGIPEVFINIHKDSRNKSCPMKEIEIYIEVTKCENGKTMKQVQNWILCMRQQ